MNCHSQISTKKSRFSLCKISIIIHLTELANYVHIAIYHVKLLTGQHSRNMATRICVYLKKVVHVGNNGCLSSVPIRWLA